jgi:hypothetical protein
VQTMTDMTTQPVSPCHTTELKPEFGRIRDVERLYGLKRGTTYNLLASGHIRGCVLRVKGKQSGVRIIDLESVRSYIRGQMDQQMNATDSSPSFKSTQAGQALITSGSVSAGVCDDQQTRGANEPGS